MDVLATIFGALGAGPKQHDRLLRLHTPLGPEVLVAESLDGVEALAPSAGGVAGYRLELTALSVDAHLDLAELLGQPVLLELQTAASFSNLRPFHGHVIAFERVGSNGGLARYRLVIEPWLALLRQRVDSYVFQDMTVIDIVESVFGDYAAAGRMVPAWRWELADRAVYRKRSLTTQYEESDLAFVERLLADEGLFYWVEHDGAPGDDSLGAHTVVIADHNDAFADAGPVRFHRSDVTERDDGIQHWSAAHRWQTGRLKRASWDYRRLDTRDIELDGDASAALAAEDSDIAGPYAWQDRATGERFIERQLEALQVGRRTIDGLGSWRQLRAGAGFVLTQHPLPGAGEDGRFNCIRVRHRARNNLGAEVLAQVEQQLGRVSLPALPLPDVLGHDAVRSVELSGEADVDFYRNRFEALPAAVPFRARTTDGHGLRLHPKPTVHGTQTAVVVSDGAPLQTDRDHRIKVQFPWQRGGNAGNRQPHPAGDDNAPADGGSWTWVRVASAWAGDNWGSVLLPRKGQEVLVAFLEGDIDRPVVVGSLYNGRGQADAPHNQVGAGAAGATGNAPAWFEGNGHGAVFTGFKSQALADSQSGSGGFQQLRLDDTPGQGRAQASTTQRDTTLTLGHLKGGRDNVRDGERGFGAELSTGAGGALRAGAGLLLSTERGHAQLDASGARAQLAQGQQLIASLDDVANTQGADLPGAATPLPAGEAIKITGEHLDSTGTGSAPGNGIGGGEGEVPAWSAPLLVATSPDGIASLTPADQVWVAGTQATLTAAQDLQWLTQGAAIAAAGGGIALYAHGSEPPAGKPNTETGIALHAAQGAVSARAPSATADVAALTSVRIASTTADVQLAAPNKHLLATAAGAYIKLEGGNIELGAPGTIEFKAAKKELATQQSVSGSAPALAKGSYKGCDYKMQAAAQKGAAIV